MRRIAGRKTIVRGMFDIVSGRETRAAMLLAGFSIGFGRVRPKIDIDGLRLSMESQFIYVRRESRIV